MDNGSRNPQFGRAAEAVGGPGRVFLLVAALLLAWPAADAAPRSSSAGESKLYRWVDDEGVVHFGDQVPPEYADHDRQVLNRNGITVGNEQFTKSEEQIAAEKRADAERAAAAAEARRDAVLLSTYLTVDEIVALRDRRIELIDSQIRVSENYVGTLREKLGELQDEAARYQPYSTDPEAPQMDANLAEEISAILDAIAMHESTLEDTRARQARLAAQFEADIARFRELVAK